MREKTAAQFTARDGMPDTHMIFWGGRKGKCEAHGLLPDAGLVVPGGFSAAAGRKGGRRGSRRPCLVNGDVSHRDEGRPRKAAPSKEAKLTPAVTDGPAADAVAGGGAAHPGGVSVSSDTKPDAGALSCSHGDKLPDPNTRTARKNQWWRKKSRAKRRAAAAYVDACKPAKEVEEEDWEKEIEELTITDWEAMRIGLNSSGPGGLNDSPPHQQDAGFLPASALYKPDAHHPRSILWFHCSQAAVRGQFDDAP
ncbi:uncharacterized protein LOC115390111 [Salarias fasciatus]|uniref:uncharacterized protein LOC115390111 n=1 Tax=Salarias fasciatus TaxID=181472 RepID=UPI001176DC78|nr:uncharacterized protein LOC115390111 [Salarias fasciatus]